MVKKIAIIVERAKIALGGAERSVFELAAALSGLGPKVTILAARAQANTKSVRVVCRDEPGRRVSYPIFVEALKEHLSQSDYDIVHSVLPFDFADVYQPRGGTYAESIQRHISSHQSTIVKTYKKITAFFNRRRTALLRMEAELARQADGPVIAALSEYVAEQFIRHYGTDPRRITVIRNGVKTPKQIDKDRADRLRAQILADVRIREADDPVLFLFVAHNFRLKGLGTLLRAMVSIANRDGKRKCCLIVVGNDKMRRYRWYSKRLNVTTSSQRVVFLGHLSHVQTILSIVDVAVLPTFYDPSSRFILEALAAGKPVITTRFNGATDLFENGRHGRVIDTPESVETLAEAIRWFTDRDNIRKASEAIAEDNLREKVSVNRVAKELMAVYESILQKKGQK
jgi:UDP-glucose:(heptosyl)LPS alpha-1,3-glucosyltransferase